jgi:transcriptional regulator with XRE-family HTH domain
VLSDWEDRATELESEQARIGPYPVPGLIRRARRIADLSQRATARAAGLSRSTVARVELGDLTPSLDVMQRLLECVEARDDANRRYPSHLETILDPKEGEWWAEQHGLARPPETFVRNRERRNQMRAFVQWWRARSGPPPDEDPDFYVEEWDGP